jgi:tRNA A-37 threonylcarbamoyl transferase component Bud32
MQLNLSHIHCSQGLWRLRVTYDPAFEGHALRALAEEPDRWMAGADSRLLKHDCTTTVSSVASGDNHWVVKRYNTKNAWHWLRRSFQRSRASICWDAALRLLEAGVATPRPVAWAEQRLGPLKGRSYYVAQHLSGTPLADHLAARDDAAVETVVAQVGKLFRNLRAAGLSHGDMKASNFLVHGRQVFLLDLDAMRKHRDAARLDRALARDRKRFLRNWDDQPLLRQRFERVIPMPTAD